MITDDDLRDLLHRVGDDLVVGAAPTEALVRRGRRATLQRRVVPLVAAAAAVAAVVAVGWLGAGDAIRTEVAPAGPDSPELVDTAPPPDSGESILLNITDRMPEADAFDSAPGNLAMRDGCIYQRDRSGTRTDLVWPPGHSVGARAPEWRTGAWPRRHGGRHRR